MKTMCIHMPGKDTFQHNTNLKCQDLDKENASCQLTRSTAWALPCDLKVDNVNLPAENCGPKSQPATSRKVYCFKASNSSTANDQSHGSKIHMDRHGAYYVFPSPLDGPKWATARRVSLGPLLVAMPAWVIRPEMRRNTELKTCRNHRMKMN